MISPKQGLTFRYSSPSGIIFFTGRHCSLLPPRPRLRRIGWTAHALETSTHDGRVWNTSKMRATSVGSGRVGLPWEALWTCLFTFAAGTRSLVFSGARVRNTRSRAVPQYRFGYRRHHSTRFVPSSRVFRERLAYRVPKCQSSLFATKNGLTFRYLNRTITYGERWFRTTIPKVNPSAIIVRRIRD